MSRLSTNEFSDLLDMVRDFVSNNTGIDMSDDPGYSIVGEHLEEMMDELYGTEAES